MFSKAIALVALATSASAHMTLNFPTPFGKATLDRAPLVLADFPCKQRTGVYDVTEMNQWDAGQTQTVSFAGTAVHGGGSCQFSLTTDAEPTIDSQWKVIHSVVGGCPSNVTGNLPDDETKVHGAAVFPITMPESIPDGRYTFAWSWLNKVGNREFYMNCAPIQVGSPGATASTASVQAALGGLPDMFVINLPETSCSTAHGEDFNYPNPGASLVDGNSAQLGDHTSGAGCDAMTKMGAGKGQLGTPTQAPGSGSSAPAASAPAATPPVAPSAPGYSAAPIASSAPASSAAPVVPSAPGYSAAPIASSAPLSSATPVASSAAGYPVAPIASSSAGYPVAPIPSASPVVSIPGVFAPGASPAPVAPSAAPVASASPVAPVAPVAPIASTAPTAPSTGSDCTPCTDDGALVCIGTTSFGLCNRGCAVAQPLATGTMCVKGAIIGTNTKRTFPRAHLHKRHGSGLRLH